MLSSRVLEPAGLMAAWLTLQARHAVSPLHYLPFWGPIPTSGSASGKGCLCQWWPAPITWQGDSFATAEHFMMAAKARLFGDNAIHARIVASRDPAEAQYLGRKVSGYDEARWAAARYALVEQGNWFKFSQHPALADYLLSTGQQVLVSANPTDTIWSIGCDEDHPDVAAPGRWRGGNLLGFALMAVRSRLRQQQWLPRLRLQATTEADLPILFQLHSDAEACRCAGVSRRDEADFYRHWQSQLRAPDTLAQSLWLDAELIGHLVCYPSGGRPHVGYWLRRDWWQQGIISAALQLFLPLCPHTTLYANVALGNAASMRVLEKHGFEPYLSAAGERGFRRTLPPA